MKHYLRFLITLLIATVWCAGGYAQETVTDEITLAGLGISGTGYKTFNKKITSDAVYVGSVCTPTQANYKGYLQFRFSTKKNTVNANGLSTSAIAGIVKSIELTNSSASFDVYVKDEPYKDGDLEDNTKRGTKLATISNGSLTYSFDDNTQHYFALLPSTGTAYVQKITIVWEKKATKTPTFLSFNSNFDATKTYTFRNGVAPSDYTKPTVTFTPADATGNVTYTSSDEDVVSVGEDGTLDFTGKTKYDAEATITAKFVATGDYSDSEEISYKVKNVEAKASLAFSESSATVVYGKESEFVKPTLTLLDAEGNEVNGQTIMYGVTPTTGIVEIDENTGEITKWIKPGTAKVEAIVFDGEYENLSAEYTLNYDKAATTIEIADGEHSVDINNSISVKAVLKANDAEVSDAKLSYVSSSNDVATVDDEGNVTGVADGKTTITVSFAGNDFYKEATSATYDVEVTDPEKITVFYESFDKINKDGQGGTDGDFTQGSGDAKPSDFDNNESNNLWKTSDYVAGAKQCLRLGAGSKAGSVTTPSIKFSGDAILTFKAGAWKGKKTSDAVVVTITNGKLSYNGKEATSQTIDIPNAAFGDFTMNIVGANENITIKFATATAKDNQFFLDEVKITATKPGELTLTEGNNNLAIDAAINSDRKYNVTLNRTMQADGGWYTFSVPFDIADVSTTPLKDAEIRQYKSMTGSTMNFEATTSLKAVHAYLVKPTTDIANPVFNNVTVSLGDNATDGADGYQFVGIYSETILETDGTNLFLGDENKFYTPTADDCKLKALRGYFVVPEGTSAAKMNINIDGGTTSISSLNGTHTFDGKVYNLNGQYVGENLKSLNKGVYIVNGKKIVK